MARVATGKEEGAKRYGCRDRWGPHPVEPNTPC